MFDFAWSELALIAVVALVVIGPKDLPRAMRALGIWVRRARRVANEFQGSLEQMLRESELDEVREQVEKATRFNVEDELSRQLDPDGSIRSTLDDPALRNPLAHAPEAQLTNAPEAPLTTAPEAPPTNAPEAQLPNLPETQAVTPLRPPHSPPSEPGSPADVWRPAADPAPAPAAPEPAADEPPR